MRIIMVCRHNFLLRYTAFFKDSANYSRRSAMIGSIRVALRAGM
jgi:hypothetical protein